MPGQTTVRTAFLIFGCVALSAEFSASFLVRPANGELWLEWRKVFRWHPFHFALLASNINYCCSFFTMITRQTGAKNALVWNSRRYDCLNGRQRMPKLTNFMEYVSTKTHFSYYVDRITCIWYVWTTTRVSRINVERFGCVALTLSPFLPSIRGPIHLRPGVCHPSLFTFRIHRTYRATQSGSHTRSDPGWGYDLCLFRVEFPRHSHFMQINFVCDSFCH